MESNTTAVQPFHFFAANAGTWRTDIDVVNLIKEMKTDKLGFGLFYVPLPVDSNYEINFYMPVVEDIVYLGHYSK